jgi:hypothetical protein
MGRACNTMAKKRNAYRILAGKPEGKSLVGRHSSRWEDNIVVYMGYVANK